MANNNIGYLFSVDVDPLPTTSVLMLISCLQIVSDLILIPGSTTLFTKSVLISSATQQEAEAYNLESFRITRIFGFCIY